MIETLKQTSVKTKHYTPYGSVFAQEKVSAEIPIPTEWDNADNRSRAVKHLQTQEYPASFDPFELDDRLRTALEAVGATTTAASCEN